MRCRGGVWAVVVVLVVLGCRPDGSQVAEQRGAGDGVVEDGDEVVVVTSGTADDAATETARAVAGTPLAEAQLAAIYARLPALEGVDGDEVEFALRKSSMPAPRAGETVSGQFPPESTRAAPDGAPAGPVEVLRYQPEGDVPAPPTLSVTFSQPMVALTSHADTVKDGAPVTLTPEPQGTWRWVGTRTLIFEPTNGFPMATSYEAEVAAGTNSAVGTEVASSTVWKFATNRVELTSSFPKGGPHVLEPVIFLGFNQRIKPAALLEYLTVTSGGRDYPIRLATAEEIAGDATVSRLATESDAESWLAIKAESAFPTDITVQVTLKAGAPSAEGPLPTVVDQSFGFRTHGPLELLRSTCGWSSECRPEEGWTLDFSNPLAADQDLSKLVTVTPRVPGLQISRSHSSLYFEGRTQGRTRYKVRVSGELRDEFGQTMGRPAQAEFAVGEAYPMLSAGGGRMVVLDPVGKRQFSVYSTNYRQLRVQAYKVTPADWPAFQESGRKGNKMPGRRVFDRNIKIKGERDTLVETAIDVSEALNGRFGHVVLVVTAKGDGLSSMLGLGGRMPEIRTWIQSTEIGLDAYADPTQMLVWATSLGDGKPLEGVDLTFGANAQATTNAQGLAAVPGSELEEAGSFLVATKGKDEALLPENVNWHQQSSWRRPQSVDVARWFVFDDRKMYKPKEEVSLKGFVRVGEAGTRGGIGTLASGTLISYQAIDSRGNAFAQGEVALGEYGGFDMRFSIPDDANLGSARVLMQVGETSIRGDVFSHRFQIQEFRRPEFEVSANSDPGPHIVGGEASAWVTAKYYAGGGLSGAPATWNVTRAETRYTPPNRSDFTFGRWVPWWSPRRATQRGAITRHVGTTDHGGEHRISLSFGAADPPQPYALSAAASVMDVNRQAWQSSTSLLVHPAKHYVGVRGKRLFVERGKPIEVESIVTDIDGTALTGRPIEIVAHRLQWENKGGKWKQVEVDAQTCSITSAGEEIGECSFETPEGGEYQITATIADEEGRQNQSVLTLWVSGGEQRPQRGVEEEEVLLIPDRQDYKPGDVAEVMIQAPFYPAEGLVTLRRQGIVSQERITLESASYTLEVPLEEFMLPNLHVTVDLVGRASRVDSEGKIDKALPQRPAMATGSLNLPISTEGRKLTVEVVPERGYMEPGGQASIDVVVRDAAGQPVAGSEVTLVVVDEAVLALSNYTMADPLTLFYGSRSALVEAYRARHYVQLIDPAAAAVAASGDLELDMHEGMINSALGASGATRSGRGSGGLEMASIGTTGRGGIAAPQITMRENFDALAAFEPALITDEQGRARVSFALPDNLTRYRVMAVAVSGKEYFGSGESAITARLPLMVRPSPPRFLNFGDKFQMSIVLQNQTDQPLETQVALRATNVVLTGAGGVGITIPANDRVEVRFPARTVEAGTARFQVGVVAGAWSDATLFELPVWTPATTEAFATYGEIDGSAAAASGASSAIFQAVKMPEDVFAQFGGLEVTTSSTQLQALTDALIYLVNYPYDCAEQISSRILAIAALRDVLSAFEAEGLPSSEEIEASMKRDIARLATLQNHDGGFGFWRQGQASWPYTTLHVSHALRRAAAKGYEVPARLIQRSETYLTAIERRIPAYYGEDATWALMAYALYVRHVGGQRDAKAARSLIARATPDGLSLESIGWLLSVLSGDADSGDEVQAIRRHLNNRVTETAATAEFVSDYGESNYLMLYSSRRTDGVILEALIGDDPKSDLIPKLVRGLLAHRKAGRWGNTQDNVFVLLALDLYFNTFEAVTPDFVARTWLGDGFVGEHAFRGRTTERHHVDIPMALLAKADGEQLLTMQKDGPGRLYYRLGMRYAPKSLDLAPAEHGFTVERTYQAVDDEDDVQQLADGTWEIRAGARVKVVLSMATPARRYHVALVDPLPAGLEVLNPALATTADIPTDDSASGTRSRRFWWWYGPWYEHQNMRDERVEAFASLVRGGVYTYTYYARATTYGEFVVPPTRAEEMYHPETFGRSGTARVVVK